jgi:hypothetical protein
MYSRLQVIVNLSDADEMSNKPLQEALMNILRDKGVPSYTDKPVYR